MRHRSLRKKLISELKVITKEGDRNLGSGGISHWQSCSSPGVRTTANPEGGEERKVETGEWER